MVQKSLRLAFFVSAQRLREAHELVKSALKLGGHGLMVTKTVATDKRAFLSAGFAARDNIRPARAPINIVAGRSDGGYL